MFAKIIARTLLCGLLLVGALLAGVVTVQAQVVGGYFPGGTSGGFYGGWGGGGWGAGSTPVGSYLSGLGQAIRAQGQYNLDTSAAAINWTEADRRSIENDLQWTNTYFEKRRVNAAYQASQKGPPTTPETWVRLAQQNLPGRLSTTQLDPVTGEITWPALLRGDEFAADRDALNQLFSERALSAGAVGPEGFARIRNSLDDALARLKTKIRDVDTRNYLEARNFLNSLGHEATLPAG